jgi:hypothetical protein
MGSWNENLLDNDDAMDFKMLWDDFVVPLIGSCPDVVTHEFIFDLFKRLYFGRRPDLEDAATCSCVFALASLFGSHGFPIKGEFRDWVVDAANVELRTARLKEWESPRKRKGILEKLLSDIGGDRRVVESNNKEVLARYKEFAKQYPRWIDDVTTPKADDEFVRLYPRFLEDVAKCMQSEIPSIDDNAHWEFLKHRLMQLAFFVAWKAKLSEEETMDLIRRSEKTKGAFFL